MVSNCQNLTNVINKTGTGVYRLESFFLTFTPQKCGVLFFRILVYFFQLSASHRIIYR